MIVKVNGPLVLFGISVDIKYEHEFNRALRLFNRKVQEAGNLKILRDRVHFDSPAVVRQQQKKAARKRWLKLLEEQKLVPPPGHRR